MHELNSFKKSFQGLKQHFTPNIWIANMSRLQKRILIFFYSDLEKKSYLLFESISADGSIPAIAYIIYLRRLGTLWRPPACKILSAVVALEP